VSDPKSPFFGRYLSLSAVNQLMHNAEGQDAVVAFLTSHGISRSSIEVMPNNFVRVSVDRQVAETLLHTQFHYFQHPSRKASVLRADRYALPASLASHIDFVSTARFPSVRPGPMRHTAKFGSSSAVAGDFPPGFTVPAILFQYYNIATPKVSNQGATQSVYESLQQSYDPKDVQAFMTGFGLSYSPMVKVIGPNNPSDCSNNPDNCVEAELDVEYIQALAQNSPTTYWSISADDPDPFTNWIMAVGADAHAPLVHSISYGDIEPMDDPNSQNRFNTEISKLAARGITVIVASGDDGVANFIARNNASACGFTPSFPATAQWVTAVGATQGPENNTAEIACTSALGGGITTGGGFSTVFAQPSWQSSVVNSYVSAQQSQGTLPPTSMFNVAGRAYPDVAFMGHNYITIIGGNASAGSGTSASAPVFAAMVTLANSARMDSGKAPLGFLNQILYQAFASNPSIFRDITVGENNCAAGDPGQQVCCQYGFYAAAGWDPLTGLGSLDFSKFLQAMLALP